MIAAENLTKHYGEHTALDGISLSIDQGEVVGLLGLNGAGKTTCLRILSGLLVQTSGVVHIDGIDMAEAPEQARARIGFLPETPPLYPEMTVEGFLEFVAHINGVTEEVEQHITDAVVATDLTTVRKDRIDTLSHGFQRRVGIAHAIVHRPPLILMDEPTSGLDPVQIVHMRKLIRNLRQRHTIIVSSHVLSEMHQMCDRILVLQRGNIVAEGTEAELADKVGNSTRLELEVRGERDAVDSLLAGHAAVAEHTFHGRGDAVHIIEVQLKEDAREDLSAALVQACFGLRRMERTDSELEDIFLQLTGDKVEQASA